MKSIACLLFLSSHLLLSAEEAPMKEFFPDQLIADKEDFPGSPTTADAPENEPDFPMPSQDSGQVTPETDDSSPSGSNTTPQKNPGQTPAAPSAY
jgi:hypothetical protein